MLVSTRKAPEYTPDPNKFDLKVHHYDGQGKVIRANHYRAFNREGVNYYERPVNSGNLWFENNQPAGRVELEFGPNGKIAKKTFDFDAPHKEYTAPLTGSDKLHYELEQERAQSAQLRAELEQIKREKEPAQPPVNQSVASPELDEASAVSAPPKLTKRGQP